MKNTLCTLTLATALIVCGNGKQEAMAMGQDSAGTNESVPVIIDDTPTQALVTGGTVELLQTDADLGSPNSKAWRDAREYQMDLGLAPPVHPSINLRHDPATAPMRIYLRAASDGTRLYLRLRWPDATRDAAVGRSDFADAAAVQFALEAGEATSFMMGAPNGPVNIWYWQAGNDEAQNLAAGGFGSTTRLEPGGLGVSSLYRDKGEWVVVFSRPLSQEGEHDVQLENLQANMAFALWQGEDGQRDGLKHVSMGWVSLQPAGVKVANTEQGS